MAEIEEVAAFLGDTGNGAAIYEGMARLYERVAADWEKGGNASGAIRELEWFAAAVSAGSER